MASIEDQLKNVRTLEDIINILAILFNNMNSISRVYYDLFVNPTPMVVPVTLYDDNGVLTTKNIPNIASYRTSVLLVEGDPNGVLEANVGAFCIDTTTGDLYYKASGEGSSSGWKRIYSNNQDNFLTPTGNGSGLTDLDVAHATAGPLATIYGGTGVNAGTDFSGLVRANGTNPFTLAVPNEDYVSPANMVGVVSHYAGIDITVSDNSETVVNNSWLVCNGAEVEITKYQRLYNKIGTKYGGNGTTTFCVPNLINKYVKGSSEAGTEGAATVGGHEHNLGTQTGAGGQHKHNRGNMQISGGFQGGGQFSKNNQALSFVDENATDAASGSTGATKVANDNGGSLPNGAFTCMSKRYKMKNTDGEPDWYYKFRASRTWTGLTSYPVNDSDQLTNGDGTHTHPLSGTVENNAPDVENDVAHIEMIPIIKF